MTDKGRRAGLDDWLVWSGATAAATVLLLSQRKYVGDTHVALAYLLLVLGATARGGRALGLALSLCCFLSLNYFFLQPYHRFSIHSWLDLLILVAFIATSVLATVLIDRARAEARAAADARSAALQEADRMKDVLLASVSHDLRTPLTTIRAVAHDMALDGDERAHIVVEEADRLDRFVTDLLDLSRLNATTPSMSIELIAADDVLGAALQQIGPRGGDRIEATIDSTEPVLVGRLDFVRTLSALVNLIDNALKYSSADSRVDVAVERRGRWLVFSVADRGVGVPEEERAFLFDSFFRGKAADGVDGTGLGLSIVKRSIELQGGTTTFAARDGGGSRFELLLPAADANDLSEMSL